MNTNLATCFETGVHGFRVRGLPPAPRNDEAINPIREETMGSVNACIDVKRDGDVAIITIDNAPVNALRHEVRAGLVEALEQVKDASVKAVVLTGAGRAFSAGADISEFGKPLQPPGLHEVIATIEATAKPVVAAIHGTALGGGLELALACHYRVASRDARA